MITSVLLISYLVVIVVSYKGAVYCLDKSGKL